VYTRLINRHSAPRIDDDLVVYHIMASCMPEYQPRG
jgi:hypothetical protein